MKKEISRTNRNVSSTGARFNAYGFAIVAGTLYWSTAANYYTGVTIASYGGTGLNAVCSYAGSNDAFIVIGYSGVSNQVSYGIKIMGYTVTVAGTTVTLTGSAANYSASNSSQLQYSIGFTTKTTLVAETTTASVVAYINYVNTQENELNNIEKQKQDYKNNYFLKDNKDNTSNINNKYVTDFSKS